jgi:hypothetical protein
LPNISKNKNKKRHVSEMRTFGLALVFGLLLTLAAAQEKLDFQLEEGMRRYYKSEKVAAPRSRNLVKNFTMSDKRSFSK